MTKRQLRATLKQFLMSPDFEAGVISSTKASWGGSGYSVELLSEGKWRVLWNNWIGNRNRSPGIILGLPELDIEDMQEYIDAGCGTQDEFLQEVFILQRVDLAQILREGLQDYLSW